MRICDTHVLPERGNDANATSPSSTGKYHEVGNGKRCARLRSGFIKREVVGSVPAVGSVGTNIRQVSQVCKYLRESGGEARS